MNGVNEEDKKIQTIQPILRNNQEYKNKTPQ